MITLLTEISVYIEHPGYCHGDHPRARATVRLCTEYVCVWVQTGLTGTVYLKPHAVDTPTASPLPT